MTNQFLEHPNEETLERFLLRRSEDQELEVVETHILACDSCITRLEALELQLTDLTSALALSEEDRIQKSLQEARKPTWRSWFTMSSLSWAGAACAALALGLAVIPQSIHRLSPTNIENAQAVEGALSACNTSTASSLSACRGAESAVLPSHRPLDLRVDTTDIPPGAVKVQVVNSTGLEVWKGKATVNSEQAQIAMPQLAESGPYFLRLYSDGTDKELLREFRFEVK
jgi:hypothetical protein